MKDHKTLIIGIGNVLLGDEGAGCHAVKYLQSCSFPENSDFIDGGSESLDLSSYIKDYSSIIMIYAINDGKPAGTISYTSPEMIDDVIGDLDQYVDVKNLFNSNNVNDALPNIHLVAISIEKQKLERPSLEMTSAIARSLSNIERRVLQLVAKCNKERALA